MKSKRILSLGLAVGIMVSSVTAFAAPGDIYELGKYNKPAYTALDNMKDSDVQLELMKNEGKYAYEGKDDKAYKLSDVNKEFNKNQESFIDQLEGNYDGVDLTEVDPLEDIEIKVSPEKLIADGKTVMEVTVTLNTPNADKMGAMLRINSKLGLKASKVEEALDKGVAKFNIQLPTSVEKLEDVITVTVAAHEKVDGVNKDELVGMQISKDVTYEAMGTSGSEDESVVRSYRVSDVRSMDMADRVAVYVGMETEIDFDNVKEAVRDQVKLSNKVNGSNPIDIIKIDDYKKVDGGYAFIALLDLKKYDGVKGLLHDNQYNYYSVEKATEVTEAGKNIITLKEEEFKKENRFMLTDGQRPEVRKVTSTKNDNEFLPTDSILVEFNEPINRETAEEASNWTINGKNLKGEVRDIRVLDVAESYSKEEKTDPNWDLNWDAVKEVEGKERNLVIIELKRSFARNEIRNKQNNLLQVKSVADWAGMTDLSDNNKISTQDFKFNYNVPELKQVLAIETQSPEQFKLELGDVLYSDKEATVEFKFEDKNDLKVTLEGKDKKGDDFTKVVEDYEIRKISGQEDEYILELTKDWTRILDETNINAYHGKTFKVSIVGNTWDVFGKQVTGKEDKVNETKSKLSGSVVLLEDTKSPFIQEYKVRPYTTKGKDFVNGDVEITMNEPVQLVGEGLTRPNLTPSLEQENVSEQYLEYVQIKDAEGKESKGIRVGGEAVSVLDQYDTKFLSSPVKTLSPGEWKLVVRSISDDVGNTMKTEEVITFTIDGEIPVDQEMNVEPYLVWGYALDDVRNELENDYVVLLFSREMDIDVLRSSTYNINGKSLDQDAKITDELIPAYRNINVKDKTVLHDKLSDEEGNVEQWMAHKITIELPKDFIVTDKDTNALTLPRGLKAVNDGIEATRDVLLGGTQYELDFEGYNTLVDAELLPRFNPQSEAFTTAANDKADRLGDIVIPPVNEDQEAAEAVDALIEKLDLGNLDEAKVQEARAKYNALSTDAKALVNNLAKLVEAEEALNIGGNEIVITESDVDTRELGFGMMGVKVTLPEGVESAKIIKVDENLQAGGEGVTVNSGKFVTVASKYNAQEGNEITIEYVVAGEKETVKLIIK